jgi:FKBP-type peptidyl-prolyl cis-trans isomerase/Domain amino terminal to FKBP-type peptidyl-prolyl isomerase
MTSTKVVTVPVFKHFWQNLIQRFKPRVHPSAGEFELELSAARQERQELLGQLTALQAEVERGLSAARQEQHNLLVRLNDLHTEVEQDRSAAGQEKQVLRGALAGLQSEVEQGLSVTREEQQSLLGQLTSLQAEFERELSAARLEKQTLRGQVSGLQDDLERLKSRDEQLRAELQKRFDRVQAERDAANQEVMVLRGSLADANSRQELTDTRVKTLEYRLREQQQAHDAALQQALVRERRQARRLTAALTVAAAAFVLGIVGSVINFWEVRNTTRLLTEVSQGISDIRTSMEGRPAGNAPAPSPLVEPSVSDERTSPGTPESLPSTAEGASREPADAGQALSGQTLPEPDFIASKSLPLDDHTFRNQQDARAFFEENARQPGVITLPSGLQYRELIPGAGRSPATSDQVVVEYRAFRPDGTETDNSFTEDLPTTFIVDESIPALKEALLHMKEGAQWELYVPAKLAYPGVSKRGPYGFEPLILTVELISVVAANQR